MKGLNKSMVYYILSRLGWMVVTLLIVTAISFAIFYIFPSTAVTAVCGKPCTPERYSAALEFMQLNKPIFLQFWDFLSGIFAGRTFGGAQSASAAIHCEAPCLGYSFGLNKPVTDLILARFPVTFSIAILSAVMWLIIGISLGIISARKRGRLVDKLIQAFTTFSISTPIYLIGLIAIAILGFNLKLFPVSGYVKFFDSPTGWLSHLFLPCFLIAISNAVIYIKMVRTGLIEAFASDYYRTFTALGVPQGKLFLKYGLRNSLLPVVTIFGLNFGGLLSGAVISEQVFSIAGLGNLLISSAMTHDVPVILGCILTASAFMLLSNFIVDALYVVIDPRIRSAKIVEKR